MKIYNDKHDKIAKPTKRTFSVVSVGLALILSTVIAWCYKEKPSVKSVVGTIIAFGGLIVMNAPMIFGIPAIGF